MGCGNGCLQVSCNAKRDTDPRIDRHAPARVRGHRSPPPAVPPPSSAPRPIAKEKATQRGISSSGLGRVHGASQPATSHAPIRTHEGNRDKTPRRWKGWVDGPVPHARPSLPSSCGVVSVDPRPAPAPHPAIKEATQRVKFRCCQ